MASASEIRELVSSYLMNSISLPQLAEKFAVVFYDIEECGNQEAIQLSYGIESQLAKASEGLLSEGSLRNALFSLISPYSFAQLIFPNQVDPCVQQCTNLLVGSFDISLVREFVSAGHHSPEHQTNTALLR